MAALVSDSENADRAPGREELVTAQRRAARSPGTTALRLSGQMASAFLA